MTFEEKLKELESLVGRMESGALGLDDLIKAFERGRALVDVCRKELDEVMLRIEKVTKNGTTEEINP